MQEHAQFERSAGGRGLSRVTLALPDPLPALLHVDQARELLGISRSTAYRAAASGDLPTLRFGHRLFVPTARLFELLGLPLEGLQ